MPSCRQYVVSLVKADGELITEIVSMNDQQAELLRGNFKTLEELGAVRSWVVWLERDFINPDWDAYQEWFKQQFPQIK